MAHPISLNWLGRHYLSLTRLSTTLPSTIAVDVEYSVSTSVRHYISFLWLRTGEGGGGETHSRPGSLGKPRAGWDFKVSGVQETWGYDLLFLLFSHVRRHCLVGADSTGVVVKDCLRDGPHAPWTPHTNLLAHWALKESEASLCRPPLHTRFLIPLSTKNPMERPQPVLLP